MWMIYKSEFQERKLPSWHKLSEKLYLKSLEVKIYMMYKCAALIEEEKKHAEIWTFLSLERMDNMKKCY